MFKQRSHNRTAVPGCLLAVYGVRGAVGIFPRVFIRCQSFVLPGLGSNDSPGGGRRSNLAPQRACKPGKRKRKKQTEEKKGLKAEGDITIDGPYALSNRYNPPHKAHCYMMGTVGGEEHKIIVNCSTSMTPRYRELMQQLIEEARTGKFAFKEDAVQRRAELLPQFLAETPAETTGASGANTGAETGTDCD